MESSVRSLLRPTLRSRRTIGNCAGFLFIGLLGVFTCTSITFGQDPSDETAPPPLKMMSKSERSELAAKTEIKGHTELALELMETRLRSAEKFRTDENYSLMYAELGGFHALMDNTLDFLLHSDSNEGRKLNGLKKFEMGLRGFVPRLELIRRESPLNFESYVKNLLKYVSDAREKAIQPLFGNTVVP